MLPSTPQSATTYKVSVRTSALANAAWDGDVYLTLKNWWSSSAEVRGQRRGRVQERRAVESQETQRKQGAYAAQAGAIPFWALPRMRCNIKHGHCLYQACQLTMHV
jgi:hypothetical protein